MDAVVTRVIVAAVGGVLFAAGSAKLGRHSYFLASILSWSAFTPRQVRILSLALPELELLIGGWSVGQLFVQGDSHLVVLAAIEVALFVGFTGMQAMILRRTTDADCGCLGSRSEMGVASISRSGMLALASLVAFAIAIR